MVSSLGSFDLEVDAIVLGLYESQIEIIHCSLSWLYGLPRTLSKINKDASLILPRSLLLECGSSDYPTLTRSCVWF